MDYQATLNELCTLVIKMDFGEDLAAVYNEFLMSWFEAKEVSRRLKIQLSQVIRFTKILLSQQLLSTNVDPKSADMDIAAIMYHVDQGDRRRTLSRLLSPLFLADLRDYFEKKVTESSATKGFAEIELEKITLIADIFLKNGCLHLKHARRIAIRIGDSPSIEDPEWKSLVEQPTEEEETYEELYSKAIELLIDEFFLVKVNMYGDKDDNESEVWKIDIERLLERLVEKYAVLAVKDLYGERMGVQLKGILAVFGQSNFTAAKLPLQETAQDDFSQMIQLGIAIYEDNNARIDFSKLKLLVHDQLIQFAVSQKCGPRGLQIFRFIEKEKRAEEETIAQELLMETSECRQILWIFVQHGFIELKEVAKPARVFRKKQRVVQSLNLYGVDYVRLPRVILQQILMTSLRIQTKLNVETDQVHDSRNSSVQATATPQQQSSLERWTKIRDKGSLSVIQSISAALVLMNVANVEYGRTEIQ